MNLLVSLNIVLGLFSFIPCLMAGGMSMDSPQAQNSFWAHVVCFIIMSFPLVCWICAGLSYYFPNSTWASGRNELYSKVDVKNYDYLIFLDDDLMFEFSLIDYEDFLYRHKPLRSSVFVYGHYFYRELTDDSKIYRLRHIDQAFMAIHTSTINVFPYSTEKDTQSWFIANEEFCCRFDNLYPKQTIIAPKFKMHNSQHREYPRNGTLVRPEDQKIYEIYDYI